jgi:hypothetical protein
LTLPLFELRRFNGVESYEVETASCNSYQREGSTEAVFVVTTSRSIASLSDTEGLRATPSIEIGFRTNEPLSSIFTAGAKYLNLPEYDEGLDEWMTNLYYCEHQGIDNVTVEIESVDAGTVTATIEGTTRDVNYYDGSKPDTTVFVCAVFKRQENLEKSFG